MTVTLPPVAFDIRRAFTGRTGLFITARHIVVTGILCSSANLFMDCLFLFKKVFIFIVGTVFHI